jgi:hypothetical protein
MEGTMPDTDVQDNQTQEQTPDPFDAAFDEAVQGSAETPPAATPASDAEPAKAAETPPAEAPPAETPPAETPPAGEVPPVTAEEEDSPPDLQKEIHRRKTLQGMFNSEVKKSKELEGKLRENEAELVKFRTLHTGRDGTVTAPAPSPVIPSAPSAPLAPSAPSAPAAPTPETIDQMLDSIESGKVVKEDFEDIYKWQMDFMKKYDEVMVNRLVYLYQSINGQIAPVLSSVSSDADAKHFAKIAGEHPDYSNIVESADFSSWIADNPPSLQKEFTRIVNEGTSSESIKMLSLYKKDRGYSTVTASPDPKVADDPSKRARLENMTIVKTKHPPVNTGLKRGANKDDYDSAFDEALSSHGGK